MHTTKIDKVTFQHNGGFDGDVIIIDENDNEVRIPYEALEEIVATKRINDLLDKLEQNPKNIFSVFSIGRLDDGESNGE